MYTLSLAPAAVRAAYSMIQHSHSATPLRPPRPSIVRSSRAASDSTPAHLILLYPRPANAIAHSHGQPRSASSNQSVHPKHLPGSFSLPFFLAIFADDPPA